MLALTTEAKGWLLTSRTDPKHIRAAPPLYLALEAADLSGFIPQDNREIVLGDGWYGKKDVYKARVRRD